MGSVIGSCMYESEVRKGPTLKRSAWESAAQSRWLKPGDWMGCPKETKVPRKDQPEIHGN